MLLGWTFRWNKKRIFGKQFTFQDFILRNFQGVTYIYFKWNGLWHINYGHFLSSLLHIHSVFQNIYSSLYYFCSINNNIIIFIFRYNNFVHNWITWSILMQMRWSIFYIVFLICKYVLKYQRHVDCSIHGQIVSFSFWFTNLTNK